MTGNLDHYFPILPAFWIILFYHFPTPLVFQHC